MDRPPAAKIAPMTTAIVSDLHLGTVAGVDLARDGAPLERLCELVAAADRVVFLGDLLELRERPAADVLADVEPALRRIGAAAAGREVVVVPGNHDHQLVGPVLDRRRLSGDGRLTLDGRHPTDDDGLAGRLAALMGGIEIVLAYPGIRLRDDVYAMHGHYLDAHLSVPRVECLIAAAVERYATDLRHNGPSTPDHYEQILAPIYALAHAIAQNARGRRAARGGDLSRRVWTAVNANGGATSRLRGALLSRAAIPAAVAAINAAGFGRFRAELSGPELRRAGLRAIAEVVERLEIDADHVIFGHTHRAGPLDGELDDWLLPGGARLTNSGSWLHERAFVGDDGPSNPYWPGRVVLLDDHGPPRLANALHGVDLDAVAA